MPPKKQNPEKSSKGVNLGPTQWEKTRGPQRHTRRRGAPLFDATMLDGILRSFRTATKKIDDYEAEKEIVSEKCEEAPQGPIIEEIEDLEESHEKLTDIGLLYHL